MHKYQLQEKLGTGAYGDVFKAVRKDTRELVAIKVTRYEQDEKQEGVPTTTAREIGLLKSLNTQYIVEQMLTTQELLDFEIESEPEPSVNLIFELMDSDLSKIIKKKELTQPWIQNYMLQIFKIVEYLHSETILHRDLKPNNILVRGNKLKAGDFGLCRHFNIPFEPMSHEIETLWYRAPELLLKVPVYSPAIDIWSIGCIFYELHEGRPLFPAESEIDALFKIFSVNGTPTVSAWPQILNMENFKGSLPKFKRKDIDVNGMGAEAYDLFRKLLDNNPTRRPTCEQAMKHPYFSKLLSS